MLSSQKNEKRLLALLMKSPTHMRALSLDLSVFSTAKNRLAASIIKRYVRKYKAAPSLSTLRRFCAKVAKNDVEEAERLVGALEALSKLPKVKKSDAAFEFEQAENFRIGRSLYDVSESLKHELETGNTDYIKMKENMITNLLSFGSSNEEIVRGRIYDNVKERFEDFVEARKGEKGDVIPFGIKPLDNTLGGMKKTSVTLMYSKTGGGKTRTAINIAYNAAVAGYNVMYFSLEMGFNLLASCFDSRMSWVDGNEIIFGRLKNKDVRKYKDALKQQLRQKLNVWIVDIAMGATSSTILEEIELYKAANGIDPDLVVIDYANIMEPSVRYNGRSEKYDFLFKEYHEIAKYANIAILTATQESRDASKADIEARKKKAEVEQGVHNIGLSNFMAPHCETVIRLKQDGQDRLQNRLWVIIDKARYAAIGEEIPLMAIWEKNYVGDKEVSGTKVYKMKKPRAYQEEDY